MTKLKDEFTRKDWKGCCGKGCRKCALAQAYIGEYGKEKGLDKLNADRAAALKAGKKNKKGKKAGKKAKA